MPKPRARFIVRLGGKRFEFCIFRTLTEMRKASGADKRAMAVCVIYEPNQKALVSVCFAEGYVTHEYVAHECDHAALAFVKATGHSPETAVGEEIQATATGMLVGRFWKRWPAIERRLSE